MHQKTVISHQNMLTIRQEMIGSHQETSNDFPVGILFPFSVCFSDVFLQEPAGIFWHGNRSNLQTWKTDLKSAHLNLFSMKFSSNQKDSSVRVQPFSYICAVDRPYVDLSAASTWPGSIPPFSCIIKKNLCKKVFNVFGGFYMQSCS